MTTTSGKTTEERIARNCSSERILILGRMGVPMWIILLIFFLSLYLLTANGRIDSGDGEAIYQVTRSMVEKRAFYIPPPPPEEKFYDSFGKEIPQELLDGGGAYGAWGADGHYYSKYGIGQSLMAIPFYFGGLILGRVVPSPGIHFLTHFSTAMLNPLVSAVVCVLVFGFCTQLGFPTRSAVTLTLVYGLGTIAWPYSKTFASEPLVTMFLLASVYALVFLKNTGRMAKLLLVGGLWGASIMVKLTAFIIAPALLLYLVARGREKRQYPRNLTGALAFLFAPVLGSVLVVFWYNAVRFGSGFDTGYRAVNWSLLGGMMGLYGLLFSPGRGLFLYMPVVILSVPALLDFYKQHKWEATLLFLIIAAYTLFHSAYNSWEGGGVWGPRLLLPMIPFLIIPLGSLMPAISKRKWLEFLFVVLLFCSVLIQISAIAVSNIRHLQAVYADSPVNFYDRTFYQPAYSPLLGQWRSLLEVSGIVRSEEGQEGLRNMLLNRASPRENKKLSEDELNVAVQEDIGILALNVPDFWFIYLWFLGIPGSKLVLLVSGLVAATLLLGYFLVSQIAMSPQDYGARATEPDSK
jgi:hypothetical protein